MRYLVNEHDLVKIKRRVLTRTMYCDPARLEAPTRSDASVSNMLKQDLCMSPLGVVRVLPNVWSKLNTLS